MKEMNDYTHIILDEVHEREVDMDFAMLIIKDFLRNNSPNVKVSFQIRNEFWKRWHNPFVNNMGIFVNILGLFSRIKYILKSETQIF